MTLAKLVYECVKDSVTLPGASLDFNSFLEFASNKTYLGKDWALQFSGVFNALNLALSRLSDADKLPYKVKAVEAEDGVVDLTDDGEPIGEPRNIVYVFDDGRYDNVEFGTVDSGFKAVLVSERDTERNRFVPYHRLRAGQSSSLDGTLMVEYRPFLPHFDEDSITVSKTNEDTSVDLLKEYGITNKMCDYIKEFVKGQVTEIMSPDTAVMHVNRAEAYFEELRRAETNYYPTKIKNRMKGNDLL